MRHLAFLFMLIAAASLALVAPAAHTQPPGTVLIQGQLLDDLGQPLTGVRGYRVRFFDAEVDGAQLGGDIVGQTVLSPSGLFAIPLEPPGAVLESPAAWYEMAIDSSADASGLTESDVFPGRIRVHSVPFARVAGKALSVEVEAIGNGSVSAEEFETLAGVTTNLQMQLNNKADALTVANELILKADSAEVYTRTEIDAQQAAQDAEIAARIPRTGPAFVVVETTDDPVQNGVNLLAAYAEAAALTPHGLPLGGNNRAVVLVPPGHYDLGNGQLELDTDFVDVEGISKDREKQYIYGTSDGDGTGVLRQTANHVRIENLFVHCTLDSGPFIGFTAPAAYFPDSNLPGTVIRNCRFLANDLHALSMRGGVEYSGTYVDSAGGERAFGGAGIASGTFINCTGGHDSFGGSGTASGNFINCTGGAHSFGGGGAANGIFINCTGGNNSFGDDTNPSSGRFYFCIGGFSSYPQLGTPTILYSVRGGAAYP